MNNTIASSALPDPTMTIKYPKDSFGHTQGNTLSDVNITREDIIDAIKTMSQNNAAKSLPHPLQLLYNYKASLKTSEISIDFKRAFITPICNLRVAPRTFPRTTVL